ncbi:unnamed protein product, partial [Allacma fusca]
MREVLQAPLFDKGTKNMLDWAKELKTLKAFVYISTAYSNSGRLKIDE